MRIGFLIGDRSVSKHVQDVISRALLRDDLTVCCVVSCAPQRGGQFDTGRPRGLLASAAFGALVRIERFRLQRDRRLAAHAAPCIPLVGDVPIIEHGDEGSLRRIGDLELDLLVSLVGAPQDKRIHALARLGLVHLEFSDDQQVRGAPAAFWEVYSRLPTTGFTIYRQTPAGTEILQRANFPTRHYYLLNLAALHAKASIYVEQLLTRIAAGREVPIGAMSLPYAGTVNRHPTTAQIARYLFNVSLSALKKKVAKVCRIEDRWSVSFVRNDWRQAVLADATLIQNPPGRYFADPFLLVRNEETFCFVEDYDCLKGRARISVLRLAADGAELLGVALDEPFHLSFPYLFEHEGSLFMCPESSEANEIRVYRCVDFPLQWRLERVVMPAVHAADSMIFERDGRWWLLTNIDPAGIGDHCSELFVFHSDSPTSTDWTAHPRNPVVVDAGFARNAGLLREGSRIFRVSQRQGFDQYGRGSQINEILSLTPEVYSEACVARIDPTFRSGAVGTHHLHSTAAVTVVDSLKSTARRHELQ